jgi:hypothetical protein
LSGLGGLDSTSRVRLTEAPIARNTNAATILAMHHSAAVFGERLLSVTTIVAKE